MSKWDDILSKYIWSKDPANNLTLSIFYDNCCNINDMIFTTI